MAAKKVYKLDLMSVLQSLDKQNKSFYAELTDEEKKGYSPLVIMRYMSSLTDQNKNAAYAVLATNDLVNIGFWSLSKYPDLQHLLLCLTGIGDKQYRPWLATKRSKRGNSKIDEWLLEQDSSLNDDELEIIKTQFDKKSWEEFVKSSGASDTKVKELLEAWKKQSQK